MSFDINTNVASLEAQNYLRVNEQFQNQTINEVTSGLRIVQSGDDAAGLAIANGYQANEAVLTQGISNANDGLSQLQIMDGGMSNITQLLNRASTLATQSATGAFTGDRTTLNDEFQSVLGEINRQAQAIGLNTGGDLAKNLQVFIGGGTASGNISAIQNGSENLNLSNSTVDTQSLGLTGVTAGGVAGTDIGPNSATSVSNILANPANTGTQAGYTTFDFSGAGFSGANKIAVNVNLSGVTDDNTLVDAINTAIGTAGAGSQAATAFKNAGITASLNTDSTGKTQLSFSSGTSAFQVQAGDTISNALLGNFSSGSTGAALTTTVTGGSAVAAPTLQNVVGKPLTAPVISTGVNDTLNLTVGTTTASLTIAPGTYNSISSLATAINTANTGALAGDFTASVNSSNQLVLQAATQGQQVTVNTVANDAAGTLGFTDAQTSSTAPTLTTNDTVTLQFQGGGLAGPVSLQLNQFVAGTSTMAGVLSNLNTEVAGNKQLAAAGITVNTQGGNLVFSNSAGQRFDVEATGDSQNVLGLGTFLPDQTNTFNYSSLTAGAVYSATNSTGTAATHATATGTVALTNALVATLSGSTPNGLSLNVDGTQYDVDLSGLNGGGTVGGLLGDINTALGVNGTASQNSAGQLVITSNSVGANASVQILGDGVGDSTAANLAVLGLTAGANPTYGQNADETANIGVSINGGANQVITASLNGSGTDATAATATGGALNDTTIATLASGLSLKIDGKQYNVASGAPATVSAFLTTLNTAINGTGAGTGTASINSAGNLVIQSNSLGTTGSVEILGNGVGDSTTADLGVLGLTAGVNTGTNATQANVIQQLNSAIAQNTTLAQAGLTAVNSTSKIELESTNSTNFRLDAYGAADIGFGNSGQAFNGNAISSAPAASQYFDAQGAKATSTLSFAPIVFGGDQQSLSFSALDSNGNTHTTSVSLNASNAGSTDQALATINAALQQTNDPTLQQVIAVKETGAQTITGSVLPASTTIGGSNNKLDLTVGTANATLTLSASAGETASALAADVNNQIAGNSTLNGLVTASVGSNNQLVLTATNPAQTVQVNSVANDAAPALGFTDGQQSVVNDGIKFISNLNNFSVSLGQVGTTPGTEGIGSAPLQGQVIAGATVGSGSSANISNLASAQNAVSALSNAVTALGNAQAVVGRGENQFNYAINLAQSQLTNFSSAEASIRDADMAAEAANLTKAQILLQAGVAALAQANSAPQQVLSLLRTT